MQHLTRSLAVLSALSALSGCALDGGPGDAVEGGDPAAPLEEASAKASELRTLATITPVRSFVGGVHGLAVNGSQRLYLSNSFGAPVPRQVYYLDPPYTGAYVATGITSSIPAGLLALGSSLYVADVGGDTVRQFDAQHQLVRQWTANAPWNLTAMPDGSFLTVSNGGSVQRLRLNSPNATTLFGGLDAPFGIASAGDGTFWVSEQGATNPGAVTRRRLSGKIVETIPYTWDNPEGLLVDREGALWIAETGRGEILRYFQGQLTVVGSGLGLPVALTQRQSDDCYCEHSPETIFANSANGPAQLLAIDPCP